MHRSTASSYRIIKVEYGDHLVTRWQLGWYAFLENEYDGTCAYVLYKLSG
jgi:hypothetical protein